MDVDRGRSAQEVVDAPTGASSSYLHQSYYADQIVPTLTGPDAQDWDRHTLMVVSPGLGAELFAVNHLRRFSRQGEGTSLVIVPSDSVSVPQVVESVQSAFLMHDLLSQPNEDPVSSDAPPPSPPPPIPVLGLDEGTPPNQRAEAYHCPGGVVVAFARTVVTDILCRRLDTTSVGAVVVWEAHLAADVTAFALTLLRDFDRAAMKRLESVRGIKCPCRCALSITTQFGACRAELLELLNPTAVKAVPMIAKTVKEWLATRPDVMLRDDRIRAHPTSRRCATALADLINDVLGELATCGPRLMKELDTSLRGSTLSLGSGGAADGTHRRHTAGPEGDGGNPASRRRHFVDEAQRRRQDAEAASRALPALSFDALVGGQLDGFLSRLADRRDLLPVQLRSSSGNSAREIAASLQELRELASHFPVATPSAFALHVESLLRTHLRRGRRNGAGAVPAPVLWMLSEHSDTFVNATVARVFHCTSGGATLRPSDAIAGRLAHLREVLGTALKQYRRVTKDAPPLTPNSYHDVVIVVANRYAVRDVVAALWEPSLEDLERHLLLDFARRYRCRVDPEAAGDETGGRRADGLLDGGDRNESDGGSDADADEVAAAKDNAAAAGADVDAVATQCSGTYHEQLLRLNTDSVVDLSQPRSRGSPSQQYADREVIAVDSDSDDDDVQCEGVSGTDVLPLGPTEVLFHSVVIESVTPWESVLRCDDLLRITVVPQRFATLSWLLRRDPRSVVVLDGDIAVYNALQMFGALRSQLRRWTGPVVPPMVRRAGETFDPVVVTRQYGTHHKAMSSGDDDNDGAPRPPQRGPMPEPIEWDVVAAQVRAERVALQRVGELRGSLVATLRTSGRQRRLVEEEIRYRYSSSGRGPAAMSTRLARQQPRWGITEAEYATEVAGPMLIFDMRELRGPLPAQLFYAGIKIVPVTLLVGDYVLSREVAVERKTLRDFCQSVMGGRIVNQLRALTIRYRHGILLIEFAAKEAFRLRLSTVWRDSADTTSALLPKFAKIVAAYPKLTIMWARSAAHAADMAGRLKESVAKENPDANDESLTMAPEASKQDDIHKVVEMLMRLPGVNAGNAQNLMDAAGSLAGLASLSLTDLKGAMGDANGTRLHAFLHSRHRGGGAGGGPRPAPVEVV